MTDELAPDESTRNRDVCAECGERIDTREWHAVTTHTDEDGSVMIVPFCDEDCRRAWGADRNDQS